jgi:hypothetical protein
MDPDSADEEISLLRLYWISRGILKIHINITDLYDTRHATGYFTRNLAIELGETINEKRPPEREGAP